METIRNRLDVIAQLKQSTADDFARAEAAAFQGRKVVEGIAFACLVAIENGLPVVPKDAKGKWNAEDIFKNLKKEGIGGFTKSERVPGSDAGGETKRGRHEGNRGGAGAETEPR